MTKKARAVSCVEALKKEYPDAICSLVYDDPLQLIIAVRLSAQCTDERVNKVTPASASAKEPAGFSTTVTFGPVKALKYCDL